jgi:hypothetical protein
MTIDICILHLPQNIPLVPY